LFQDGSEQHGTDRVANFGEPRPDRHLLTHG